MSLEIFENELKSECRRLYSTLRDGSRDEKLKKRGINSLTDIFYSGRHNPRKLFQGCVITFGKALEIATINYAQKMDAKVYRDKRFLSADIDIVFRIRNIVYNLESKANIELDIEKTKKAFETLMRKHKIVFNGLDCQNEHLQVISKFVVWTKETAIEASKIAKRPLEPKYLMGFKDFFELFNVHVTKDEFFDMLKRVWNDEVEVFFTTAGDEHEEK
jgi:hypothetical protein